MCLKKINVNPANRVTDDSFVKSLTLALNLPYKEIYRDLSDYALGQSLAMTDIRAFKSFLKSLGFCEQRLQRGCNVESFVGNYAEAGKVYILAVGKNNATVIRNKTVYDNYDVSKKIVHTYWKIN